MNLAAASYPNLEKKEKKKIKNLFESLISIFWQKEKIP